MTKNIRALLVDDETPARNRLARMLEQYQDLEIVGQTSDGLKALEEIERLKPDVVFLDIEMPELDGLGVAQAMGPNGPKIVFVTAYDEHALRAFEVSAIDYLLKPVTEQRLETAMSKLRKERSNGNSNLPTLLQNLAVTKGSRRFAVKCGAKYIVFDPSKVSAILARDHYAAMMIEGRELLADDPLDELVARLNPEQFIRIHRSAAINVDYLQELEHAGDRKYIAVLSDSCKTRVPVSRERLADLKNRLGIE